MNTKSNVLPLHLWKLLEASRWPSTLEGLIVFNKIMETQKKRMMTAISSNQKSFNS